MSLFIIAQHREVRHFLRDESRIYTCLTRLCYTMKQQDKEMMDGSSLRAR